MKNKKKTITMHNLYGDGSGHKACVKCGFCNTCGDCEKYGCKIKNES